MYNVDMIKSKVKQQLDIRGWTPYELSKRASMSTQTAARLATGDTNFSLNTLLKLCEVFQVRKINEIVEYIPD